MPSDPVRVAILNDYEIVVAGLATLLEPYADRVRVVELDSRRDVVSDVDVVLYDTFAENHSRLRVTESLPARARLVVFTWRSEAPLVREAMRAGASGFLSKEASADQVVDTIERVAAGERVVPPIDERQAAHDGALGRWPGDEHGLSPRESEVLALLCQGLSNEEIADRAFIGINTVKTHIRTMYRKIGVTSRTQAVVWGHNHGFDPDRSRRLT